MRRIHRVTALLAALLLVLGFAFAAAAEETVTVPDLTAFTWSRVPLASKQENAAFSVYSWYIPAEISADVVEEYMSVLQERGQLQRLALADDPTGVVTMACAMPACTELGFRTGVGEETVKGCHLLWVWQADLAHPGAGTMFLYLSRGVELADTGDRTLLLPEPTPTPTAPPAPSPKPLPSAAPRPAIAPVSDPDSGSYMPTPRPKVPCPMCHGKGTRPCKTCDGKGYLDVDLSSVPRYDGVGSGGSGKERVPCPNLLCFGGEVDCMYCGGKGEVDS